VNHKTLIPEKFDNFGDAMGHLEQDKVDGLDVGLLRSFASHFPKKIFLMPLFFRDIL
jgi:hypothetical protein